MDGFCFRAAVGGGAIPAVVPISVGREMKPILTKVSAVAGPGVSSSERPPPLPESVRARPYTQVESRQMRRLWPGNDEIAPEGEEALGRGRGGNWVLKILRVGSIWAERGKGEVLEADEEAEEVEETIGRSGCCDGDESDGCCDVGEELEFDRDSFSRLLRRVSLVEAKLFAKLSYLGGLAYSIPSIKPVNLLKHHGLRFVTSSLEKKSKLKSAEKEPNQPETQETEEAPKEAEEAQKQRNLGHRISVSATYQIAASAASYLHSQTRSILPFKSKDVAKNESNSNAGGGEIMSSEVASFVATTNSVTAVVAAKEEAKQAVAKDLNSVLSSPCEWFVCDEEGGSTRYFVIQGSDSLASWQANLLFEPIQFEGLDVFVHRGIYEAAKGIYEQVLPEVRSHLSSRGRSAALRFTGHSLGGSLALLVNLMLLIRGEAPARSLLPVIMFGSPSIMCGGDHLLRKLGLPKSHVQAITMHRDIVPRAFSCNYPDHVAELLKAINANFRNYPCLEKHKLLYAPMGELLILQPDEKFSPHHPLLPSGSGLYLLARPIDGLDHVLWAARAVFLNSPHPLEILSDRSAYGSDGSIYRDHDMKSYLRSMRGVIREELKQVRKARRERHSRMWWPLVAVESIVVGRAGPAGQMGFLSGAVRQFERLIASQHMQMLVILLFPVGVLLLGTLEFVRTYI
ncbi:hypothetical protein QJS04_geneDACA004547 [Acorus gramineus]|uniref:Fungal lipase-type domain-containing protein n=1 Tax=Acorus gramineus TaxID=55184 RepID=A0AAV9BVM3_ACOGR|nr:hypothetical protein QJS04_geneDACA004547 [Acorus gramineus]